MDNLLKNELKYIYYLIITLLQRCQTLICLLIIRLRCLECNEFIVVPNQV